MSLYLINSALNLRPEAFFERLSVKSPSLLRGKKSFQKFFSDKRILVTGAGGSIGSEICRQLALFDPSEIILIDNNEYFLWKIRIELSEKFPSLQMASYLADVASRPRIEKIFLEKKPQIVFHAAALKHVKIVEENPCEGFLTNLVGTQVLSEISIAQNVKNFIFLSTDKAVKPKSRMGASKRIAELYLQRLSQKSSETSFAMVRFGNVWGSAGSVLPLFKHQIAQGGPVTVTHKEVKRYFITCEEAVASLLEAAFVTSISPKQEILFILDMGKPVQIIDLARSFIEKAKKDLGLEIKIKITGLEKGEKIKEDLLYENEQMGPVLGTNLFRISFSGAMKPPELTDEIIQQIEAICRNSDSDRLLRLVSYILPEFPFV